MNAKNSIKKNNTIIFLVDEYSRGQKEAEDGQVQFTTDKGAHVIYLSGYKSRNDFIPWEDIIAKVNMKKPYVTLKNTPFIGHFEVFTK